MSPLISRKLDVPANLDGRFLINVNFCKRGGSNSGIKAAATSAEDIELNENKVIDDVQKDIEIFSAGSSSKFMGNKRKNK